MKTFIIELLYDTFYGFKSYPAELFILEKFELGRSKMACKFLIHDASPMAVCTRNDIPPALPIRGPGAISHQVSVADRFPQSCVLPFPANPVVRASWGKQDATWPRHYFPCPPGF